MGMRMTGFSSGMDINQIVTDLMKAERIPLDKMKQSKKVIEWKVDDYREINNKMNTFRNNIFDTVLRSSNMLKRSVISSNSDLVTATASSAVGNVSFNISKVSKLATSATNSSASSIVAAGATINSNEAMINNVDKFQTGSFPGWKTGGIKNERISGNNSPTINLTETTLKAGSEADSIVKVDGKTYEVVNTNTGLESDQVFIDTATGTLTFGGNISSASTVDVTYITDTAEKTFEYTAPADGAAPKTSFALGVTYASINSVEAGGQVYTAATDVNSIGTNQYFYNQATGEIRFNADSAPAAELKVNYQESYTTAGIDAYNETGEVRDRFLIKGSTSMNKLIEDVNRASVGVSMFFDDQTGKVSVTRKETGQFNTTGGLEMTFSAGFFETTLQLKNQKADPTIPQHGESGGTKAEFTINGLETTRNSNTFDINGMNITLKQEFTTGAPVTLTGKIETDDIYKTIKGFIDEYNDLLKHVNGKLTEDRNRSYQPLSDEQREAMSEKEIELWEEKARSGLLKNDTALRSQFDKMRVDMYSPVSSDLDTAFRQLSSIGITTSRDYMERGKLEIDEDKLRAAIEKDPEGVFSIFASDGETTADKGIARRIRDSLDNSITDLANRAGGLKGKVLPNQYTLGRNMSQIDERISNFERRLQQTEERYWRQFNAMESAMAKANAQAESLFAALPQQA